VQLPKVKWQSQKSCPTVTKAAARIEKGVIFELGGSSVVKGDDEREVVKGEGGERRGW
jgi:hypothetical protein